MLRVRAKWVGVPSNQSPLTTSAGYFSRMQDVIIHNGRPYLATSSAQLRAEIEVLELWLAIKLSAYEKVRFAERAELGTSPPVDLGFERVCEFDAAKLDTEFATRYAESKGPYFTLYGPTDNILYWTGRKPVYDPARKSFCFKTQFALGNNPRLISSEDALYGANQEIRSGVKYRFYAELEFGSETIDRLQELIDGSTGAWWTLLQAKNTAHSDYQGMVWGLTWDRTTPDHLRVLVVDNSGEFATIVGDLPIAIGRRQSFQLEQNLETEIQPAGGGFTKIWWDGILAVDIAGPNCVARNDGVDPAEGIARGVFFGSYLGMNNPIQLSAPLEIAYSNMALDVEA